MKKNLLMTIIVLLAGTSVIPAQSARKIRQMEDLVSTAYAISKLGTLDQKGLRQGKITIVIEHSIYEEDGKESISRKFSTFKQAEKWLYSRETPQEYESRKYRLPFRTVGDLAGCRRGLCLYEYNNGILHNHLYLKKIFYGYRRGRVYVKTIHLYDGD